MNSSSSLPAKKILIWEDRGIGVPPQNIGVHNGQSGEGGSIESLLEAGRKAGFPNSWGVCYEALSPMGLPSGDYSILIGSCPASLDQFIQRNAGRLEFLDIVRPGVPA